MKRSSLARLWWSGLVCSAEWSSDDCDAGCAVLAICNGRADVPAILTVGEIFC